MYITHRSEHRGEPDPHIRRRQRLGGGSADYSGEQLLRCCANDINSCAVACTDKKSKIPYKHIDSKRTDMSSLMQEGAKSGAGEGEQQEPMSMQQRVIQSGLDSLKGKDAPSILLLFKGFAIYAVPSFALYFH